MTVISTRRIAGFISALLLVSILLTFSVGATEFEPKSLIFNFYANGENYGGYLDGVSISEATGASQTGTFSIPLDLDSRFSKLLIGATYDTIAYDYGANYKYVITITTGTSGSYSGSAPILYGSVMSGRRNIDYTMKKIASQSGTKEVSSGDTYTFTYDNIPYENIQGNSVFFLTFSLSSFSSLLSDELYIVNSYFGLESFFDQDKYDAEMIESLDNIEDKLQQQIDQDASQHEETKGLLDRIIEGITGIPGKIKESISNLIDEIKESVVGSITSTMNSFLETLKEKLGILYQAPDYFIRIIQAIMITEKSNEMTFPSMVIPVGGEQYTLNEATPFQIFPDWIPDAVYTFINLATSIVVIFAVINFAEKKWEEISTNG